MYKEDGHHAHRTRRKQTPDLGLHRAHLSPATCAPKTSSTRTTRINVYIFLYTTLPKTGSEQRQGLAGTGVMRHKECKARHQAMIDKTTGTGSV